jgi:hypothetical protein
MARIFFSYDSDDDGIKLRLTEKRWHGRAELVPVTAWADRIADKAFSGISRILALADDVDSAVEYKGEGLSIDHATIASLSEPQALGLGLPPSVRSVLQVNTKGLITDPDFQISGRWIDEVNRPLRAKRKGALLFVDGDAYRVPEPLFGLVSAIDVFSSDDTRDDDSRMERLARLQLLLPQEAQKQLSIDKYFSNFRVMHASAFSLSLRIEGGSFDFDPVLFGRRVIEQHGANNDPVGPVSEAEGLLTEHQQDIFASQRFRASDVVKPSYIIERGVYLHLDSSLRAAMTVVRQMQSADPESRKRFVQAPLLYIKEALSNILADDEVEHLFVETEQYSARVIDVGIWTPPVLPWIKKEPNDWLPEKFGLQIGGQYVVLKSDEIEPLRERIKEARDRGDEFIEFGQEKVRIPTTAEAEQSLSHLMGAVGPKDSSNKPDDTSKPPTDDSNQKRVLIVEENFDTLGFIRKIIPRARAKASLPAAIRPSLMTHQQNGLDWMQESWARGYAGVLLADDMGLGKTLQALGFLAWLREIGAANRSVGGLKGPIIIVAPTGLLANWEKEHNNHLHSPGLGEICRAYGRHLKVLKTASTRDVDRGAPSLDQRRIQQANWVLTTYETLRDHHLSFAAIPFACAVFDEMQKVKSPSSLLTRAAKTLNADFTLGLTGTPIENQLVDLWCIMDIINPGCLSDLKSFSTRYPPDDHEALKQLHGTLLVANSEAPAPMLRRMKADELDGLPDKKIHMRKRQMPEAQARVYGEIVSRAKEPESGPMLETLHLLRGISLHPIWPPAGEIKDQRLFIDQSARLTETFLILDEIAAKKEKSLIFLESLDLQEHLALMIKTRYSLKRRPMQINGEVSGERRQALVDEFQAQHGAFDAMILSPRAGGVGLTLTSANHVIHLSRWWNPAVEDQCTDRVYRIGQDRTVHIYYPMAVHPLYGESSFDVLLNALLDRKRDLSRRMLLPPVNAKQDQNWFAENIGRQAPEAAPIAPIDIEDIDVMEALAFERWVLGRCISIGWEASRTPKSYDGGADGVLLHRLSGARAIVQCKHTQNNNACGPEAIDDLLRARSQYAEAARLFVITNARQFSRTAHERAEKHGIVLIGRSELAQWPAQLLHS